MNLPNHASTLNEDKRKLLASILQAKGLAGPGDRDIPRRDPAAACRASSSQRRLWLIDQLEGGSAAYHMVGVISLRGELDEAALGHALDRVVERHDALRTRFRLDGNELIQCTDSQAPMALERADLSVCAASEREAGLRTLEHALADRAFDLASGPLIRACLVRIAAHEHALIVAMHHIVSDGWSLEVLGTEIATLYGACRQGQADPLPQLPIQYADYTDWQRRRELGEGDRAGLAYWQRSLSGAPALLALPTDRARPPKQSHIGAEVGIDLGAALSEQVEALARTQGVTPFVVLFAAFAVLLARLSGQDDVVIGTPVANRDHPQVQGLIGFFVNTLALRMPMRMDASVATLLKQAHTVALDGYDHQQIAFDRVVEALNPARSLGQSPLFQAMFAFQTQAMPQPAMPGIQMALRQSEATTAKFDLTLSLQQNAGRIHGRFEYASDLFDRATVASWAVHLRTLLEAMAADPQARIEDLQMLDEAGRRQVLEDFNATATELPPRPLHELFRDQARRTPDASAVEYREERLSYAQLDLDSDRLAERMRAVGVGKGTLAAIALERGVAMAVAVLAVLKAGAAYVPIDPEYPAERIAHMLRDACPTVLLTQASLTTRMGEAPSQVLLIDATPPQPLDPPAAVPAQHADAAATDFCLEDPAYVIYTSGSTGLPKGVVLSHRALANLIHWHLRDLRPSARVLQFASLSFDASFHEFFAAWLVGAALVIPPEDVRRDARLLLAFLHQQRIGKAILPVVMLQHLAACEGAAAKLAALEEVMATGEQLVLTDAIRDLFAALPACRLHNHYGPSETHVVTAATLGGAAHEWPTHPSIGRPIDNCRIYVLDARRQLVPVGVVGEVFIGGYGVANGYLNRPELDAERFVADPFGPAGARMYRSGDLGRWRDDGTLEYLGRNDHQIKIRGFRIEPGEIEARLLALDEVDEALVLARETSQGERRLVAYLKLATGRTSTVGRWREHLRGLLPDYMVPAAFVTVRAFPLTPNGKLDRAALPPPDVEAVGSRQYRAPEGGIELALAQIWSELLGVAPIGRDDNFFELGGHSLLALQVAIRASARFGFELSLRDAFDRQTLASLAGLIAELQAIRVDADEIGIPSGDARQDRVQVRL